jgi:putative redox protein
MKRCIPKTARLAENNSAKIDHIERVIRLRGALDDAQRKRLVEIADNCPVHKTLHQRVKITTRMEETEAPGFPSL